VPDCKYINEKEGKDFSVYSICDAIKNKKTKSDVRTRRKVQDTLENAAIIRTSA
jgi:hypothetical protein